MPFILLIFRYQSWLLEQKRICLVRIEEFVIQRLEYVIAQRILIHRMVTMKWEREVIVVTKLFTLSSVQGLFHALVMVLVQILHYIDARVLRDGKAPIVRRESVLLTSLGFLILREIISLIYPLIPNVLMLGNVIE